MKISIPAGFTQEVPSTDFASLNWVFDTSCLSRKTIIKVSRKCDSTEIEPLCIFPVQNKLAINGIHDSVNDNTIDSYDLVNSYCQLSGDILRDIRFKEILGNELTYNFIMENCDIKMVNTGEPGCIRCAITCKHIRTQKPQDITLLLVGELILYNILIRKLYSSLYIDKAFTSMISRMCFDRTRITQACELFYTNKAFQARVLSLVRNLVFTNTIECPFSVDVTPSVNDKLKTYYNVRVNSSEYLYDPKYFILPVEAAHGDNICNS